MRRAKVTSFSANIGAQRSGKVVKLFTGNMSKKGYGRETRAGGQCLCEIYHHLAVKAHKSICWDAAYSLGMSKTCKESFIVCSQRAAFSTELSTASVDRFGTLRYTPYPAEEMTCCSVSPRVGNVKNNDPSLIEPVAVGVVLRSSQMIQFMRLEGGPARGIEPIRCESSVCFRALAGT
jgi:hypothetical protein